MSKIKTVFVAGATASGKTELAIKLAQRFDGEIVSADSMQIYKGMNIATAKPDEQEKQGIPHWLTDFLPSDKTYSVADFVSFLYRRYCVTGENADYSRRNGTLC